MSLTSKNLSAIDEVKFYVSCRRIAASKGYCMEICEDFPGWAYEKMKLENRTCIEHLLIDYLRKVLGTKKSVNRETRTALRYAGSNADELDRTESGSLCPEGELLGKEVWNIASGREREVLSLYFKDGSSMLEIADHLGLSERRVGQILKEALSKLNMIFKED